MTVIQTKPMENGAPLPGGKETPLPSWSKLEAMEELERARVELMYALAMRRKAWAKVRIRAQEIEVEALRMGTMAYADSDARYKVAIGDVRFWQEGITAQAAAIGALESMLDKAAPPPPAEPMKVRDIVLTWDAVSRPTDRQYNAAANWLRLSGMHLTPANRDLCQRIVAAYVRH